MDDPVGAAEWAGEWSELKDSTGYSSYDSWALLDPLPDPTLKPVPGQSLQPFLRVFAELLPTDGPGCADATYAETIKRLQENPGVRYDATEASRMKQLLAQERSGPTIVPGEDDTVVLMLQRADIASLERDELIRVLHIGPAVALADRMAAGSHTAEEDGNVAALTKPDDRRPLVLVGIVEDTVPFLNARFRTQDGGTRFERIWLQSRRQILPTPRDCDDERLGTAGLTKKGRHDPELGLQLTQQHVDAILKEGEQRPLDEALVYSEVNDRLLRPGERRSTSFNVSHGAQVIDLACGATPGEMDEARILAVQLPPHSVLDTSGRQLDPYVIQAVRWLTRQGELARQRYGKSVPLIINLSLGILAGPKDGTGFIESWLKREVARYRRRNKGAAIRIVLAYGNSYRMRQVAHGKLAEGEELTLDWRLPPDDRTDSFLEVRADAGASVEVLLQPPGGDMGVLTLPEELPAKGPGPHGRHREWRLGGKLIAAMLGPGPETPAPKKPAPAKNVPDKIMALLAVRPTTPFDGGPAAPVGAWTVKLRNKSAQPAEVALQIQRDDTPDGYRESGRQSYFDHPDVGAWDVETFDYTAPGKSPITRQGTHSSYASVIEESASTYAVGAARRVVSTDDPSYREAEHQPSRYTSAGTKIGFLSQSHGPTLSAFGDDGFFLPGVRASGPLSGSSGRLSGTSAAAPQIARALVHLALSGNGGSPAGLPDLVAPADREAEVERLRGVGVNFPQDSDTRARLGAALIDPELASIIRTLL